MALVLAGGWGLLGLGGVASVNAALIAAGIAQAVVLFFGRIVGVQGRYLPGLLLFLGGYAVAEAREGRGLQSPFLIPVIVLLALVRVRLSLVVRSEDAAESKVVTDAGPEAERDPRLWGPWLAGLLLPLLLTLLGLYSAKSGSAGQMSPWFSWLPDQAAWNLIIGIRKVIHCGFYSLFAYGALIALGRVRTDVRANAPWALALTAIFAIFDETRQSHIVGRTGSPWDVLLDLTAATILLAFVVRRIKLKG